MDIVWGLLGIYCISILNLLGNSSSSNFTLLDLLGGALFQTAIILFVMMVVLKAFILVGIISSYTISQIVAYATFYNVFSLIIRNFINVIKKGLPIV
jgi:hypothetical protein